MRCQLTNLCAVGLRHAIARLCRAESGAGARDRGYRRCRSFDSSARPLPATAARAADGDLSRSDDREGAVSPDAERGRDRPAVLAALAERSFAPAPGGGYTLKFDRESFFGGDGLPVEATIRSI